MPLLYLSKCLGNILLERLFSDVSFDIFAKNGISNIFGEFNIISAGLSFAYAF